MRITGVSLSLIHILYYNVGTEPGSASEGSSSASEELSSGSDGDSSGWEELLSDGLSEAVEDGSDEQPAAESISSAARRSAHRRRVNFMGIPPFLRGSVTHIIIQELEADKPV